MNLKEGGHTAAFFSLVKSTTLTFAFITLSFKKSRIAGLHYFLISITKDVFCSVQLYPLPFLPSPLFPVFCDLPWDLPDTFLQSARASSFMWYVIRYVYVISMFHNTTWHSISINPIFCIHIIDHPVAISQVRLEQSAPKTYFCYCHLLSPLLFMSRSICLQKYNTFVI